MDISWIDPTHPPVADVAGAVAVAEAARVVDCPFQLNSTAGEFVAGLRHGWDGDAPATAVARNSSGAVVAVFGVMMPTRDNTHLGEVFVTVDPSWRRRGIGTQLFSVGVDRIKSAGRTLVVANCWDGTAGVPFGKSVGLDRASEGVMRRQDLHTIDRQRVGQLAADAREHARDYELQRLPGAVPDDLLEQVARMTEAINDAPTDDLDVEDEVFSPGRIRAFEAAQDAYQRRMYRLLARHRGTGELAGHTMTGVWAQHPWQAWQFDTSIVKRHRGHRLGLLLKAEMLDWLREAEPQLDRLDTGNAASNTHMIGINEALGYRIMARVIQWQRHL
jgi:GNAT superfamily N-acetyltransferase